MTDEKEEGGTDCSWKVESGERQVEVSTKMVRELEDVLAVRSEKRERQREERRQRRREKRTELEKTEEQHKEKSDGTPVTKDEQEDNLKNKTFILATDVGPSTALKSASLQSHSLVELKEMELPNIKTQTPEPEEHNGIALPEHSRSTVMREDQPRGLESHDTTGVSHLAARVAAIAAGRRGTAQTEETYGSDSSHSE